MARKKVDKKRREICILGYAEETRDMVFDLDESVEVWGINMAHMFLAGKRKADRWLQIHPRDWSSQGQKPTGYWGRPKGHYTFLKKFKGPVYMSYPEPDIPNCVEYPFERFRKKFKREYFTGSFAYLVALAIDEKVDKIYLYGINLTAIDEWVHQRPGLEYWLGRAEQAGIEVVIPPASALLKAPTSYGLKPVRPEDELGKHVTDRIESVRSSYLAASYNHNTAMAMQLEIQHWDKFLGGIVQAAIPELEAIEGLTEEQQKTIADLSMKIKDTVSARFDKRRGIFESLQKTSNTEMSVAQGRMQSEQHYLSVLGGVDSRAGALPEVFYPNPVLATDIEKPERKAV